MVEKNERILWLDIARAIAIILVVCGHCNFTTWSIQSFSGLFFMPLFIFISGYLFKDRVIDSFSDLTAFLKRRVVPIYKYYHRCYKNNIVHGKGAFLWCVLVFHSFNIRNNSLCFHKIHWKEIE